MKAFMEEYGLIAVVAIVVLLLAMAASTIGGNIATAIKDTVQSFTDKVGELTQNNPLDRPVIPGP